MKYIAKEDSWFDTGTRAILMDDYRPEVDTGLFLGRRHGKLDEEVCAFDEFEIVEEDMAEAIDPQAGNRAS